MCLCWQPVGGSTSQGVFEWEVAFLASVALEALAKLLATTVQTAHHRADRDLEDVRDLLVGELLEVCQQDHDAVVLGELLDGVADLVSEDLAVELVLFLDIERERMPFGRRGALFELVGVVREQQLWTRLTRSVSVVEGVGQDAREPCSRVGANLVPVDIAKRLEHGLLDQILGLGAVARHPNGHRVERVHVGLHLGVECFVAIRHFEPPSVL